MLKRITIVSIAVISFSLGADESSDIAPTAQAVQPLGVGESVPTLTVRTAEGEDYDLNKAIAEKPTVIVFYRGGWCPICMRQLSGLAKTYPKLQQMGYQLLAISPEKPDKAAAADKRLESPFTLLADPTTEALRSFGVAFGVDSGTVQRYKGFGVELTKAPGTNTAVLPAPAVFIVSTDGVVRFRHYDPDYRKRIADTKILAEAEAALEN